MTALLVIFALLGALLCVLVLTEDHNAGAATQPVRARADKNPR